MGEVFTNRPNNTPADNEPDAAEARRAAHYERQTGIVLQVSLTKLAGWDNAIYLFQQGAVPEGAAADPDLVRLLPAARMLVNAVNRTTAWVQQVVKAHGRDAGPTVDQALPKQGHAPEDGEQRYDHMVGSCAVTLCQCVIQPGQKDAYAVSLAEPGMPPVSLVRRRSIIMAQPGIYQPSGILDNHRILPGAEQYSAGAPAALSLARELPLGAGEPGPLSVEVPLRQGSSPEDTITALRGVYLYLHELAERMEA